MIQGNVPPSGGIYRSSKSNPDKLTERIAYSSNFLGNLLKLKPKLAGD